MFESLLMKPGVTFSMYTVTPERRTVLPMIVFIGRLGLVWMEFCCCNVNGITGASGMLVDESVRMR